MQIAHFLTAVYRYRSGRGGFLYAYRPHGKDYGNGRDATVFQGSAVRGYTVYGLFSGLALLIVNGLTNLAAALLSAKKRTELCSIQCKTGEYKKELSDGRKYAKNAE